MLWKRKLSESDAAALLVSQTSKAISSNVSEIKKAPGKASGLRFEDDDSAAMELFLVALTLQLQALPNLFEAEQADRLYCLTLANLQQLDLGRYAIRSVESLSTKWHEAIAEHRDPTFDLAALLTIRWFGDRAIKLTESVNGEEVFDSAWISWLSRLLVTPGGIWKTVNEEYKLVPDPASGERPELRQELTCSRACINRVVVWFIENEEALQDQRLSSVFQLLMLLGYVPLAKVEPGDTSRFFADEEHCGFRTQVTTQIFSELCNISSEGLADIDQRTMSKMLTRIDRDLKSTVLHLRSYDKDGTRLQKFLAACDSSPSSLEVTTPAERQDFREYFEQRVFFTKERQHLAAIYVSKNFMEVVFYILCWFYVCWFGTEFRSDPLPDE